MQMMRDTNDDTRESGGTTMTQWSDGLSDGAVVSIEIRRWRGMTCSLGDVIKSARTRKSVERQINSLVTQLLPREIDLRLRTTETKARTNLSSHSFPCDALNNQHGRFVPCAVYADFAARNARYRNDYEKATEQLLRNYDDVTGGIIAGIAGIVTKECGSGSGSVIDAIVRMLPSKSDIADAMSYEMTVRRVPSGIRDTIAGMDGETGMVATGITLAEKSTECLQPPNGRHVDIDDAKAMVARDIYQSTRDGDTDHKADDFMVASATQLRKMLVNGCAKIVASMDRNGGTLVGRSSVMAHNMVTILRAMDYYGDADLQQAVSIISYELDGRDTRDQQRLRDAFIDSEEWARDSVRYLHGGDIDKPEPPVMPSDAFSDDDDDDDIDDFLRSDEGASTYETQATDANANGKGVSHARQASGGTIVIPRSKAPRRVRGKDAGNLS